MLRCQHLAQDTFPPSQGQAMPPSGARMFYFTRLVLQRRGVLPPIEPDTSPLEPRLVERFLEAMPQIASQLAADYRRAVRFLVQPDAQAQRFLATHPLRRAPELSWAPEHLVGISRPLRQLWQGYWRTAWKRAERDHLLCLLPLLRAGRLLVTMVAPPRADISQALLLLRDQLARDALAQRAEERTWPPPVPDLYLYDEPLDDWLLRPLLSACWLLRLCQVLADLAEQVPALVRERAAKLGADGAGSDRADDEDEEGEADAASASDWQARMNDLPLELRRRIPPVPQGTVTAEAIYYYTTSAWRAARAAEAAADPLLPDERPLAPTKFRALLALAIHVTEHLLWDETLPVRAQLPEAPARRQMLREAVLPPRLRRRLQWLLGREEQWRLEAEAKPFSPWAAWEHLLQATLDDVSKRLEASVAPTEITPKRLEELLRAPLAPEAGRRYFFTSSLADYLQAAFPEQLLDGNALLAFCRALAEEVGAWPTNTPGAPASAEQAALAIFWFCKLALEARSGAPGQGDLMRPGSAPNLPGELPRREDGGLVVWLDTPLPPAALELAAALAPLIARVLHHSSWEAAEQGQPLLVARLKARDQASWDQLKALFREQAQAIGASNVDQVVEEALDKLRQQMDRVVLPADVTMALLSGKIPRIDNIDFFGGRWYTLSKNAYQFLGEITAFARRFVRRLPVQEARPLGEDSDRLKGKPVTEEAPADTTIVEDETVREMLALIVQAGEANPAQQRDAQDALLLARGLLHINTGRTLIKRLAGQGAAEAQAVVLLWLGVLPQQNEEGGALRPRTGRRDEVERVAAQAALARFLAAEPVHRFAARRRAVAVLFELPMRIEHLQHALRPPLGTLERLAAWTQRPGHRAEVLHALYALGRLAKGQRQAVSMRLLEHAPVRLTLVILEQSGWERPPWLQNVAFAGIATGKAPDPIPSTPALVSSPPHRSPQLFQAGRLSWLAHLAASALEDPWRARALTGEWLGIHFWSNFWLERPQEGQAARFYQTLLKALPGQLSQVVGAAWSVALAQKLAHLCEIVGLAGCMPPQIPAQLDTPEFFEAIQEKLLSLSPNVGSSSPTQHDRIRLEFQVARRRILSFILAIAGVPSDRQRKVLMAAFSLANGRPAVLNRWIGSQQLSEDESQALYRELEGWQPKTAITAADVPRLLRTGTEQVKLAWDQLRREYSSSS